MKVTQLLHRRNKTKATVSKVSTTKRSLEDTIASSSDDDDEDNSRLSSLSDSTTDDLTSVGEDSEDMERFERSLRQKHAKACKAMANGVYDLALQEFESILSDILARHGEKHERVGAALHNVAIANLRAGSLDDAMDAIEEAIKIRSRALGRSHPKVADSLVELGIILLSMEEHADSLKVFDRALRLRRSEPTDMMLQDETDENNLKIAKVLNNMGCVNYERHFLEEAKKSFQEAVGLQKSVFRNMFNLSVGYDTSSPGILTMASTMCNLGYVAIEQGDFSSAIKTLTVSLKIQKAVLGQSNKLVQSTLDNLGYAAAMQNQYDASLGFYNEIWLTQKDINESNEEKVRTLRKLITAAARTEDYDKCFAFLEVMEDLLAEVDPDTEDLFRTRKLMGEVNYQLLKLPSLSDQTNRAVGFALCIGETEEDVDLEEWVITKPENTSKMSGHRVTHA